MSFRCGGGGWQMGYVRQPPSASSHVSLPCSSTFAALTGGEDFRCPAWAALRWAVTLGDGEDPWRLEHVVLSRVFLVGCGVGAKHRAQHGRASLRRRRALRRRHHPQACLGAPLPHGSKAVGGEMAFGPEIRPFMDRTWGFVVSETVGLDDPHMNPFVDDAACKTSAEIPCDRVLVCVAENDFLLKERALWYHREIKASGYAGEVELFKASGCIGGTTHRGSTTRRAPGGTRRWHWRRPASTACAPISPPHASATSSPIRRPASPTPSSSTCARTIPW
ncbi:tuliposide A-converting enzyme 1, chloroplastic [Sorghum bicolor]|uniref:tuliposide A-converting enzyme 1, chloroplastic n=1 Tax=Sorghum bicolor TaxID=4558 RepID=UPI000B4237AF|nr:tuliposide A-converting enzyme 1, chloroplastic [Sorghum bicolor]|eukprot:XP_002463959.2 tuliposide A-converting enzyme 1, chloroplastic [Sorghum bicolor]